MCFYQILNILISLTNFLKKLLKRLLKKDQKNHLENKFYIDYNILMNQEYITLIFRDGTKHDIDLNTKSVDIWNEHRIKALGIDPKVITSVEVGPKTALIFFSEPEFGGNQHKVINSTPDSKRIYKFGDFLNDHEIWRGNPRSFIIYTWDKYNEIYGTRYCSSDSQCKSSEYCMCPTGATHPSFCVESRKRRAEIKAISGMSRLYLFWTKIMSTQIA